MFFFPLRLWDGGEKRINKRISVIVLAFGVKWSILSALVICFCGSQKDFLFHSCISSWMTESLTFRASFLFWRGDQSLVFTLLFYIPWKHRVLLQTRLHGRTGHLSSRSCAYSFCNEDFPLWVTVKSVGRRESDIWRLKEVVISYYWCNTHFFCFHWSVLMPVRMCKTL